MKMIDRFKKLETLISTIPAIQPAIVSGTYENGFWWVKFSINIQSTMAWNVVRVFAYTINYLSIDERLSTVFYPVSPNPFDESHTDKTLSWIIESTSHDFMPDELAIWLETRIPDPHDEKAWKIDP